MNADDHLAISYNETAIPLFTSKLIRKFHKMRQGKVLTDVMLICGEKKFYAHRCYLAATSNYFLKLFGNVLGSFPVEIVNIPHLNPVAFETVLEILYNGYMPTVNFEKLRDVLIAAEVMDLESIFVHYRSVLFSRLNDPENVEAEQISLERTDINTDIIDEIYQKFEPQKPDMACLRNLISHISLYTNAHNLLLKVIIYWIQGLKTKQLEIFEDLIEIVDFKNVSTSTFMHVRKDSIVSHSEVFKKKYLILISQRFQMNHRLLYVHNDSPVIYVLGQNYFGKNVLQKFHKRKRCHEISLNNMKTSNAAIVIQKSQICAVIKGKTIDHNKEVNLKFTVFTNKGCRCKTKSLGTVPFNAQLLLVEFKGIFISAAYTENTKQFYFNCNQNLKTFKQYCQYWDIIKLEFLTSYGDLFTVLLEERLHGQNTFFIHKLSEEYKWCFLHKIEWKESVSNWFAYYELPSHLMLQIIPGYVLKYDLQQDKVEIMKDRAMIPDAISVCIWGYRLWCLTRNGCIYIQVKVNDVTDWKLLVKPSVPLYLYLQMAVDSI